PSPTSPWLFHLITLYKFFQRLYTFCFESNTYGFNNSGQDLCLEYHLYLLMLFIASRRMCRDVTLSQHHLENTPASAVQHYSTECHANG
ncbi:hypothetical protein RRG08_000920, partial [Elysia crispata]